MSEAAMCQVFVAAQYAAHPERANLPPARASFDCQKAHSSLEKAICSDIRLGHADIVLDKVYKQTLRAAEGDDRRKLIASQRKWIAALPVKCGLSRSSQTELQRLCLRNQIEKRFNKLDCDEISDCVRSLDEPDEQSLGLATGERASFDCERPATALQIVVCADEELGQKDIQLAKILKQESSPVQDNGQFDLSANQVKWSHFVEESCPVGTIGGIPSWLTRACVGEAYEQRMHQLQTCPKEPADQLPACLENFKVFRDQERH